MSAVHLLIKGKVQGVFYRASAKKKAMEFGVSGWIKNTEEGNVEAKVSGSDISLQNFIKWCKQGPGNAVVIDVIATPVEDVEKFKTFTVLN